MDVNPRSPQNLFTQQAQYEIPRFQRRYVWKQDEQWEPLWDDVEQVAEAILDNRDDKPHFMGAVVLQQIPVPAGTIERRLVVDGQQRLTTLQLLLDAVQEVLAACGHDHAAKRLAGLVQNAEEFLGGNADYAFKVWPTMFDRDAFRHAMRDDLSVDGHAGFKVVQAHDFFRKRTKQWLDRFSEEEEKCRAAEGLETALREKLELVVIDLDANADPHIIFETLNARGTPLLQSDMVRNKILHDAADVLGDGLAFAEDSDGLKRLWPFSDDWWNTEVGRGRHRRPRVDVYLNHWLTLRHQEPMTAYEEFRDFEKYADDNASTGILNIADDLGEIGGIYRSIEEGTTEGITRFLDRRRIMNAGAVTPLLLWLLSSDVPREPLLNCITAIESFLVRRVVCGYSARSHGEFFVSLIRCLDNASRVEVDHVLASALRDETSRASRWPTNEEVREMFVSAPLYQWLTRGRLRMVLVGIEEHLYTRKAEASGVSDVQRDKLQIEHIMPQGWRENDWPLPSDDVEARERRERLIHTIGNLTLVTGPHNSSLSNDGWGKKRRSLGDHSVLFLNRRLVNEGPQVWNEDAIEERSKWLYEAAVKVWPRA